ncbi:MAG: hypothetical protein GW843_07940 [Thiomicrospira sp.]|nr:hypothetical protein [Thiomicrospira sp.]OIP96358.1 MAG: hypothetical protein AUK56_02310 [Thiomicrospira sp. CG2_30_44_34]NCN66400.1 hypothetical protein [Thiomicrospira sp.]NCO13857.1 hypothetical protein [Thiomicrospira sp.]NCO80952.1 hypothetical protein [Thiomicrospira sp.]
MNLKSRQGWLIWSWCFISWLGYAHAETSQQQCVLVTGTASLDGVSEDFARQMAIRNGLKLASMQNNLSISSDQVVTNYTLHKDMTHFTSQSKVSNFAIVEEGIKPPAFDDLFDRDGKKIQDPEAIRKLNTYQVKLEVCLTEDPRACNKVPGNHLQPKLAVARPVIADSYQGRDISNLLTGYHTELERRLKLQGYQNLVALEESTVIDTRQPIAPNLSPEVMEPIRETTGAQYVLLTVIRSISAHNEDSAAWNKIKRFYNHEIKPNVRYLEVEFFVVDLIHNEVVSQQREGFDVKGDVEVGRDRPFGTSAFFATDTGMVFDAILRLQTQGVYNSLKCQPVESQIIDIRDGEYVLYLTRASGARVGDEFAVYHRQGRPVRYQGVRLGSDSTPTGFLKIIRLHSKFAVAEVLAKEGLMEVGDSVRSW